MRRFLAGLLIAGCVALTGCAQAPNPEPRPSAQDAALVFEPDEVDLGTVHAGQTAEGWLRVRNRSDRMAQIVRVETSCGCTAAEPEERVLAPGAFTRLHVRIDTFAKRGGIEKWVDLIDAGGGRSRATVRLRVLPAVGGASNTGGRSLFAGSCARCHAEPADGLADGAALYRAVCAMCHGPDGAGAYAPRLAGMPADAIAHVLREGTGSAAMPAFARDRGGPLDGAQISALASWLSGLDGTGPDR